MPREPLAREAPSSSLSTDEEHAFESWHRDVSAPAWFFLDSVDELKLTQQKLETALKRFAKAIDGRLSNVHVTIALGYR